MGSERIDGFEEENCSDFLRTRGRGRCHYETNSLQSQGSMSVVVFIVQFLSYFLS